MAQCCVVWVAGLTFGAQLFTATLPLSSPGAVRSDLLPPVSSRSRRSSRDPLRRISCSPASASRPRQRRPAARPATTPTGPPRCGGRSAGRRCPRRGVWCAVAGLVSALGARNALPRALRRPSVAKNIKFLGSAFGTRGPGFRGRGDAGVMPGGWGDSGGVGVIPGVGHGLADTCPHLGVTFRQALVDSIVVGTLGG